MDGMQPEELAGAIKQLNAWAQRHAPAPEHEARRRLREHFGEDPRGLPIVGRPLQLWDRPNLQVAVEAFLEGRSAEVLGIVVMRGFPIGLGELARGGVALTGMVAVGAPEHVTVALGEHESVTRLRSGIWLVGDADDALAVRRPREVAGARDRHPRGRRPRRIGTLARADERDPLRAAQRDGRPRRRPRRAVRAHDERTAADRAGARIVGRGGSTTPSSCRSPMPRDGGGSTSSTARACSSWPARSTTSSSPSSRARARVHPRAAAPQRARGRRTLRRRAARHPGPPARGVRRSAQERR